MKRKQPPNHWPNVARFVPQWEKYNAEIDELVDAERLHRVGPLLYQRYLYALVRHFNPEIVVETGVRNGPSTVLTYLAMRQNVDALQMYSCDPCYESQEAATKAVFAKTGVELNPRFWTFFPQTSSEALTRIGIANAGGWNFFLHDSDHGAENMAFELTRAWAMLYYGGVIVCDDWQSCAGAPKHGIFEAFCAGVGEDFYEIGTAAFLIKGG